MNSRAIKKMVFSRMKKKEGKPFIFEIEGDSFEFIHRSGVKEVDWGDGVVNSSNSHNYATSDRYTIKIYPDGDVPINIEFDKQSSGNSGKLRKIVQWGNLRIEAYLFNNTTGFDSTDSIPDIPKFISENIAGLFAYSTFNQPINDWNVSNVTIMSSMFYSSQFNQPIGDWDVGNVNSMDTIFYGSQFNQPINDWNVSNVTNMNSMFNGTQFNQPIGDWDVGNATIMTWMFSGNQEFIQDISNWCVKNIPEKPLNFDRNTNPAWTEEMKPKWGEPCN